MLNTFRAECGSECVYICVAKVCCSPAPGVPVPVPVPQSVCVYLCVYYPLVPMTSLTSYSVMQSGTGARSVAKCLCAWACVCAYLACSPGLE